MEWWQIILSGTLTFVGFLLSKWLGLTSTRSITKTEELRRSLPDWPPPPQCHVPVVGSSPHLVDMPPGLREHIVDLQEQGHEMVVHYNNRGGARAVDGVYVANRHLTGAEVEMLRQGVIPGEPAVPTYNEGLMNQFANGIETVTEDPEPPKGPHRRLELS